MINDVESLKIKVMKAMRIYNHENNIDFDLELVNKLDYCKTVDEINKLLENSEFKEIKIILNKDAK